MKISSLLRPAVLSVLLLSGCASAPPRYLGVPSDPWVGAQSLPPAPAPLPSATVRRTDELLPDAPDVRDASRGWEEGPSYEAPEAVLRVSDPSNGAVCSGGWDAASREPVVDVRLSCDDGRTGTVVFGPSGGWGDVRLSDSTDEPVSFGRNGSGDASGTLWSRPAFGSPVEVRRPIVEAAPALPPVVPATGPAPFRTPAPVVPSTSTAPMTPVAAPSLEPAPTPSAVRPSTQDRPAASGSGYGGNCATPDDLDSAGRRCGRRSAASRPGGYDGYGSWAGRPSSGGGTVSVRGYVRKDGTYVRPHVRRR